MMVGLIATTLFSLLSSPGDAAIASQSSAASDQALRAFIKQTDREWPGESFQQALTVDSLVLLANAVASLAQQKGILVRLVDDVAQLRANIRGYQADYRRMTARARVCVEPWLMQAA
jgi:hypothetical protein